MLLSLHRASSVSSSSGYNNPPILNRPADGLPANSYPATCHVQRCCSCKSSNSSGSSCCWVYSGRASMLKFVFPRFTQTRALYLVHSARLQRCRCDIASCYMHTVIRRGILSTLVLALIAPRDQIRATAPRPIGSRKGVNETGQDCQSRDQRDRKSDTELQGRRSEAVTTQDASSGRRWRAERGLGFRGGIGVLQHRKQRRADAEKDRGRAKERKKLVLLEKMRDTLSKRS